MKSSLYYFIILFFLFSCSSKDNEKVSILKEKDLELQMIEVYKDGFKELKPCKNCFYPRKMEEGEKAIINGREVRIENYINRSQEIGK